MSFELIVHGGLLVDGSGRLPFKADIVVFNPDTVADTATYLDSYRYPVGIVHVLVNGVAVVSGGEHAGALPGRPLRHSA